MQGGCRRDSNPEGTRTLNLRIDSPILATVSTYGERVYGGQIKTYGTKVEPE